MKVKINWNYLNEIKINMGCYSWLRDIKRLEDQDGFINVESIPYYSDMYNTDNGYVMHNKWLIFDN